MPLLSLRLTISGTGIRTSDGLTLISLLELHCGCIQPQYLRRHTTFLCRSWFLLAACYKKFQRANDITCWLENNTSFVLHYSIDSGFFLPLKQSCTALYAAASRSLASSRGCSLAKMRQFVIRTVHDGNVGCKVPAKRSHYVSATYRNIVGSNMLRAFDDPVALCCDMLGVVDSNFTIFKLKTPKRKQHVAICCVGMLRSFGRGLRGC